MQERFELNFELIATNSIINSTGIKPNYYSLNKKAEKFGYLPTLTSLEGVSLESEIILNR
jgi:hypothetical protein